MGKYYKGILGAISGLVGTVVGASWRDIDYLRSKPKKSNKPASESQVEHRAEFTLMRSFMDGDVSALFNVGFQSSAKNMTPFNAAFSENLRSAVTGVYPALTIDYPEFVFAKGNLLACPDIALATTEDAQLDFSWINNADVGNPLNTDSTDKVTFAVYNPAKQRWAIRQNAALRSALSYSLVVPAAWSGDMVHIWAGFVRSDLKKVSDSVYVGPTSVQ
jgi:hypothetical protein